VFLTGFIIPLTANPHAGLASHLEGVMNGTFLLALGCAWSELRLGALAGRFVHALLTFGAWANWAATLLSASAGDQQGNAAGRRRPRRDASAREPRLRSSRRWA
jgi:cytochrome bd-type quinol oxidase subunit 1